MATTKEPIGHYSLGVSRKVFILGRQDLAQSLARHLGSLNVMPITECDGIWNENQPHLVIAPCSFTDPRSVHVVARCLTRLNSPDTYKVLYVTSPHLLNIEHFIFCAEAGAHFMVFGHDREMKLKEHLKRLIVGKDHLAPSEGFQLEYQRAKQAGDVATLNRLYQKISDSGKGNLQTLRLLVQVSHTLGQLKKTIFHLKQILAINPQDLWALNILMKIYHVANKPEVGLQLVSEHTDYGRYDIVNPQTGLVDGLAYLTRTHLSAPVFNFLNTRATLAVQAGRVEDGLLHLNLALRSCPYGPEEESKILYNMGLAYLKLERYQEAVEHLERSVKLGESKFAKAVRPLKMAQKQLQDKTDLVNLSTKNSSVVDTTSLEVMDENLFDIEII